MTFIWSDIETNGDPDPETGHILEVGFFLTESKPPFRFLGSVGYVIEAPVSYQEVMHSMPPEVRAMHEKSGLTTLLSHPGIPQPLATAELECIELISRFVEDGDGIMAGRGISWFDRPWIQIQMPKLYKKFHPRTYLDLTQVRRFFQFAEIDILELDESMPHRATVDAEYHYNEFINYKNQIQLR